jgi:hypothetical protein
MEVANINGTSMNNNNNNIRMLIVNEGDEAVVDQTIGRTLSSLPVTNLQRYSNSRIFRSPDVEHVELTYVWAQPRLLSGVSLWRHNMSDTATWRVELFEDIAMTILLNDSLIMPAVRQKALGELEFLIDPLVSAVSDARFQSSDYWFEDNLVGAMRITLIDVDNSVGHIDVTRIYVGRALQPNVNFSYGHSLGWLSATKKKRTNGGTLYARKQARPRQLTFTLDWLSESDRPHFFNAINKTGDDTDWYVSMYPETGGQKEQHYAFACMFTSLPQFTSTFNNNYQGSYALEEA